jgi:hypothetical protein
LTLIPITGQGSKTIVKGSKIPVKNPKPEKPKLKDILGDHFDAYWAVAGPFSKAGKNFAPIGSATAYMAHINAGVTDEQILKASVAYRRYASEPQFLKQLVNWLDAQDFTTAPPEFPSPSGAPNGNSTDRFANRRQAE